MDEVRNKAANWILEHYYLHKALSEADDLIALINNEKKGTCKWEQSDPESSYYKTSCKNSFMFCAGTPEENHVKFCPFCAKEIKEIKP